MNTLKYLAVVVLGLALAACNKEAEKVSDAAPPAASSPAPVVNPVDSLAKNLATDKYDTKTGELIDGRLISNGKDGFVLFGPYVPFQAGAYTVTFKGRVEELPAGGKVRLDAGSNKSKAIHGGIDVTAAGDLPSFEFVLTDAVGDLEVRVLAQGGAKVSLESYQVTKKI